MKAAVVSEIGKLEIRDIAIPTPGPYDVLCRMCYGATCAGTDIHLIDGLHPYPVSYPTILGHESVGRVVEIGKNVRNFRIGDLVSRVGCPSDPAAKLEANWGGFCEYGIARDHWQMRKDGLPEAQWNRSRVNQIIHPEIDERTAPMIITWRETLSYIKRLGVEEGTTLLLIGSGANALSFAAHACNLHAKVTVVGSSKKMAAFFSIPIEHYFDYRDPDLLQQIQGSCQGGIFDVLLDGVGGSDTVNLLLPLLHKNAVLGVYGWNGRKQYGLNPFSASHSFRIYADGYDEEETNGEVQSMVLQGKLNADLWYHSDNPVALADIAGAYNSLRKHEAFKYLIAL